MDPRHGPVAAGAVHHHAGIEVLMGLGRVVPPGLRAPAPGTARIVGGDVHPVGDLPAGPVGVP